MAILESIIKANEESRKVNWPICVDYEPTLLNRPRLSYKDQEKLQEVIKELNKLALKYK